VLTVTVVPAGATVVWASTDPAVASVDATGQVTAVAPGAAAITATAGGRMAVCVVTVTDGTPDPGPSVTSVTLDRTSLSLGVGSADVLTATTVPAGAPVAWASTHPSVASVTADGAVTGAAPGAAAITATAGGRMAVCVVTVGDGRPGGTSGGGGCSSLGLGGLAMVACAASVLKRKAQRHRRTRTS
ncbi:MAG: Ig-like domain-containing protein, partial [Synergistaceae bacterium]|nr:Ig-like domain-containing protein [Synergistaceae bacterium]